MLHLHRFHDRQRLTAPHAITRHGQHLNNLAWHRRANIRDRSVRMLRRLQRIMRREAPNASPLQHDQIAAQLQDTRRIAPPFEVCTDKTIRQRRHNLTRPGVQRQMPALLQIGNRDSPVIQANNIRLSHTAKPPAIQLGPRRRASTSGQQLKQRRKQNGLDRCGHRRTRQIGFVPLNESGVDLAFDKCHVPQRRNQKCQVRAHTSNFSGLKRAGQP